MVHRRRGGVLNTVQGVEVKWGGFAVPVPHNKVGSEGVKHGYENNMVNITTEKSTWRGRGWSKPYWAHNRQVDFSWFYLLSLLPLWYVSWPPIMMDDSITLNMATHFNDIQTSTTSHTLPTPSTISVLFSNMLCHFHHSTNITAQNILQSSPTLAFFLTQLITKPSRIIEKNNIIKHPTCLTDGAAFIWSKITRYGYTEGPPPLCISYANVEQTKQDQQLLNMEFQCRFLNSMHSIELVQCLCFICLVAETWGKQEASVRESKSVCAFKWEYYQ